MKHVRNCNSGLMGYRQLRRDPRHRLTRALQHESHRQQLLLTLQQHAPSAWRESCPAGCGRPHSRHAAGAGLMRRARAAISKWSAPLFERYGK